MQSVPLYTPETPLRGLMLVKDGLEADGAFLIPYSLHAALQEGLQVIFVALANSISHYQYVLRKLGMNLQACREAQKVCIMDEVPAGGTAGVAVTADPYSELAGRIERTIQDMQRNREHADIAGTCLIFDSFSALRCLHSDEHQWRRFVHHWSWAAVSDGGTGEGPAVSCILALVHDDVEDDGLWMRYLEHAAQTVIAVDALEMGQASDINGQVTVTRRAACLPGGGHAPCISARTSKLLNYKLQDNGVRFTACRATANGRRTR